LGTFGCYRGNYNIEEEKKAIFNEQMAKVLNYGGMMSFEEISMYGYHMGLLKPFAVYPGGSMCFHYNYFEDDSWETAEYDAETAQLYTDKIGGWEFCDVITAAYFLYEVYDTEIGFTYINGDIVNECDYVGWLNQLLGTDFSMKKRFCLWEGAETVAAEELEGRGVWEDEFNSNVLNHCKLEQIIPKDLEYVAVGTELSDLLYIIYGTDSLTEEEIVPGSYPYDVWKCKRAIIDFIKEYKSEAYETLVEILKMDKAMRFSLKYGQLQQIGLLSQYMPSRVFLYLFCEQEGIMFWKRWFQIKEDVYRDEQMKNYATEEFSKLRMQKVNESIPKVRTSDFLRSEYLEWDVPEEVKKLKKVFITDDDRLYWWDGTDEVIISDKTKHWLAKLGERHKELTEELKQKGTYKEYKFLEEFLLVLKEVDEYYRRVFPFQSMFYEFLQNGNKPEYIAAVELLREIANEKENRNAGKLIEYEKSRWGFTDGRITRNKGRMRMKRYLAVMANAKLREEYFEF